jgi:eukaryotic-like serine/threonine-protein kinase
MPLIHCRYCRPKTLSPAASVRARERPPMPPPTTSRELLEVVRKSGLVEEERLGLYLQRLRDEEGLPVERTALAERLVRDGLLTAFQARRLLRGKANGFFLGKYKVLRPLGKGGMGQVFLAEQGALERPVALKVLATRHAEKPAAIGRFLREARALAAMDHPNIVRAYDVEQQGPVLFLVLEYVEGASLREVLDTHGPLDVARAVDVIRQAARGLQHAHEAGWVHRDIKPGNLLLTPQGTVKVLDLGLARLRDDDTDCLTREFRAILGTIDYLAPEQSLDSHAVDGRADIYALGATFYELLTGQPPFRRSTIEQKVTAHRHLRPRPLRLLRAGVPAQLETVLERMLAKKPAHRYQAAAEVVAALAPFVAPEQPPSEWLPAALAEEPSAASSSALTATAVTAKALTQESPALSPERAQGEDSVAEQGTGGGRSWLRCWWAWALAGGLALLGLGVAWLR